MLALEPTPRIAALLRRTAALNGVSAWVEVQDLAAGEAKGSARFGLSAQTTHNSLWAPVDATRTIRVAVRPLDALVAPGGRVDAVKIDAEGAEVLVWRGMRRVVSENPGLAVLLAAPPAQAAAPGGVLPSDPVVRLVLLGVAAGLLLVLLGGTGLWLTRRRR